MTYIRAAKDFLMDVKIGLELGDRLDVAVKISWFLRGVR